MSFPRHPWPLTASLALWACIGCGSENWQAETVPVNGTLRINGQPALGAIIELHAASTPADVRNSRAWGVVADDGRFSLTTYKRGDGAPAGTYNVTVRWPTDAKQPMLDDRLGGQFASPQRAPWQATIAAPMDPLDYQLDDVEVNSFDSSDQQMAAPPMGIRPSGS
jgi:hypothetical protein